MNNSTFTASRRQFLSLAATAGAITVLPFNAFAGSHAGNKIGDITVHPVAHASIVLETPAGTIYVDPVGDAAQYAKFPKPDMVLITHHHGDHFKAETLDAVVTDATKMIVNPEVYGKLSDAMKAKSTSIGNGESSSLMNVGVEAIPAYNTTEERAKFHPKGRDNGYIVTIGDMRIYISGDTEDTPEMRALKDINLAFVCMNLPFTMDAKAAASAVAEFKPTHVYPYHYRGKDDGTQDPEEFAKLVGGAAEVLQGNWYD